MSMKLRVTSGTYNVQASEEARHKHMPKPTSIPCVVAFLDDTEHGFEIDKRGKAQTLLDAVFDHLELVEKDYFGLQFVDVAPSVDAQAYYGRPDTSNPANLRWLDPLKPIKKQMRIGPPYYLYFRVKFYVSDPSKLMEEYTRYHFFLQLKKDILEGRLFCPHHTGVLLAGYAVQSELGDYHPEEHTHGYLSELRFIPAQTEGFEKEVEQFHKQLRGQNPAEAEYNYLEKAKRLEMYGVDLHCARDQSNLEIKLGVTSIGLVVFQNNVRINTFSWAKIVKISFKRKQFFIQLRKEMNDNVENLIGFNMISYRSCKNLWKSCVEHHTFFRLHSPPQGSSKKLFSLGSKFRYSGRTEYQTVEESKRRARIEKSFSRSPSKRYARRTVGGTTRDVIMEEKNIIDGYKNTPIRNSYGPQKPPRLGSNSTTNIVHSVSRVSHEKHNGTNSIRSSTLPNDFIPKKAWTDGKHSDDEGGFLTTRSLESKDSFKPVVTSKMIGYTDDSKLSVDESADLSLYSENHVPNGNSSLPYQDSQGLVNIRMRPDEEGRFGFNVKGGVDQGMPIIVSRVAPNTPADLCIPRLNEGDQVLYINGRDVSQHTHEQVVMFIRASRETHSGELALVVRPNVYIGEDQTEEPDFQYIPDTHHISTTVPHANALASSLILLQEALESGAALAQFDQLYRKKPGMTMNAARDSNNTSKNRYRDISPYDQSRVPIRGSTGDYINANFVNMEIPGSGIINRYVAAQGPLPNTCSDFWEMAWEQHCSLVVMLTAQVERGRVKCHKYWPDLYDTTTYGHLQVTCLKEQSTPSFAFREFTIVSTTSPDREERHVRQMQYIAWPDHGVPDDPTDFLDFVSRVRQDRLGMVEPTIVHCSAGIGRTGVLITMETALCLIEANQPVYPLDIVRQMRDQRAMLIQTQAQYKFVCEAIVRVHSEGLVKPLDDYIR